LPALGSAKRVTTATQQSGQLELCTNTEACPRDGRLDRFSIDELLSARATIHLHGRPLSGLERALTGPFSAMDTFHGE
jgi:hypothetical protein